MHGYDPKETPWRLTEEQFPRHGTLREQFAFLLRYAILAPSSHNTQPWKFYIRDDSIGVLVDKRRWLRVADPDQRELFISTGCALENLVIAALHFGFGFTMRYFPEQDDEVVATVRLSPGKGADQDRSLFAAITERHTEHRRHKPRAVSAEDLQQVRNCCTEKGVRLFLSTDPYVRRGVDELVVRADATLFSDRHYRGELAEYVGQGVFGEPWMIAKVEELAIRYLDIGKSQGRKDSELLMSSPIFGVIGTKDDTHLHQVKAGQLFERIYLTATSLGMSVQPLSNIVQLPNIRNELLSFISLDGYRPQQPFRLGYADKTHERSPRRSLEEFLI